MVVARSQVTLPGPAIEIAMRPALLLATLAGLTTPAFTQTPPCYETNWGTLQGFADENVFPAVNLSAPFPLFGSNYTQVEISSNGFVWMGGLNNFDSGCCSGTGAALVAGATRICALWTDLVTDGVNGSGIYHNPLPGRDVITWANAYEAQDPNVRFTIQLQLLGSGSFTVWYHPSTSILLSGHTTLCGVSPGGNVSNPGSTDLSASFPFNSNTQRTVYEQWPVNTFDLAQRTFQFLPTGQGGWLVVDRPTCPFPAALWQTYGQGCPPRVGISGASFYELFTGAIFDLNNREFELTPVGTVGYTVQATTGTYFNTPTNTVPLQDDDVQNQTLPFPFPHPGGVCTIAGFCSNGFLWIDNFNNAPPAAPFVPAFLFDGPRIAALWTDLDPTAFGTTCFDTTATAAIFTWSNVAQFNDPTRRSTFQIQLLNDGRIRLCYRVVNIGTNRPILAGYGLGGATWDPGSIDLTASVPFTSGTGTLPLMLDWTGVPPVIGSTFPLNVDFMRPTAVAGFLVLGMTRHNPGISLASLGMPNCFQYTSTESAQFFPTTPPLTVLNLVVIPTNPALAGLPVQAQVAVFDPGITPLGVQSSNGGTITVGLF